MAVAVVHYNSPDAASREQVAEEQLQAFLSLQKLLEERKQLEENLLSAQQGKPGTGLWAEPMIQTLVGTYNGMTSCSTM